MPQLLQARSLPSLPWHPLPQERPCGSGARLDRFIFAAFHKACDGDDLTVARRLLDVIESCLGREEVAMAERHRISILLVAAHERLWTLRHREARLPLG